VLMVGFASTGNNRIGLLLTMVHDDDLIKLCFRWREIYKMVGFRNAVEGTEGLINDTILFIVEQS